LALRRDLLGLVFGDAPHEVDRAGEELGDLRVHIGNAAHLDILDACLMTRAAFMITLKGLQRVAAAGVDGDDFIRAGAYGLLRKTLRADLLVVLVGIDRNGALDVVERSR